MEIAVGKSSRAKLEYLEEKKDDNSQSDTDKYPEKICIDVIVKNLAITSTSHLQFCLHTKYLLTNSL